MPEDDAPAGVKSTVRTLEILELLAGDNRQRTLAEISRELGLPRSSAHAIVHTMVARGWLRADAGGARFGLGIRSLLAGTSYVDTDDVVTLSGPALDQAGAATGETIHLGRLDGGDVVYLAKRESVHPLRLYSAVGRRLPAHATALGKALLAGLSAAELHAALGEGALPVLTARTIATRVELDRELHEVRERGYAIDRGENAIGISCFAVAVGGADAISCSVPDGRLDASGPDDILAALRTAATEIAAVLGRFAR